MCGVGLFSENPPATQLNRDVSNLNSVHGWSGRDDAITQYDDVGNMSSSRIGFSARCKCALFISSLSLAVLLSAVK